jgi:glucoamylase
VKIGQYKKGSATYKALTKAVREWANKIVLQLAANTPKDYVLVECIEKEKGGPCGPRGMIRSLAAALGVYDAFNGLVPPNWGHPIPKRSGHESADEVIESGADYDDGYHSVDPALYRERRPSPSWLEETTRHRYGR